MASKVDQHHEPEGGAGGSDLGYAAWKRAKIERGLAQSRDRATMIAAEQVLRDLKLGS